MHRKTMSRFDWNIALEKKSILTDQLSMHQTTTTKLCMQSSSIYSFNVISSKDNRKIIGAIYWIFEAFFFHFSAPQHLTISTIVYDIGMQLFYSKTIYVLVIFICQFLEKKKMWKVLKMFNKSTSKTRVLFPRMK